MANEFLLWRSIIDDMEFLNTDLLAHILSETIKNRNVSLRTVSNQIGVSPSSLSRIARGELSDMNVSTLVAITRYCRTNILSVLPVVASRSPDTLKTMILKMPEPSRKEILKWCVLEYVKLTDVHD